MTDRPAGAMAAVVRASEPDPELRSRAGGRAAYLDAAYARLDVMRRAAERVAEGYTEVQRGGTHQARLEREAAEAYTRRRLAGPRHRRRPPVLRPPRPRAPTADDGATTGTRFYIGRISVTDEDLTPLVVDWRAPVAEPFYRATAVEPMGVARRRHFQTHGRRLVGLDDEVFDAEATDESGLHGRGRGRAARRPRPRAAPAACATSSPRSRPSRTKRSGPTWPASSSSPGGPGTGKTAVALHRAAYLLYTHRKRLGRAGRAARRAEPDLPALHRRGAPVARRGRGAARATVAGLKPAAARRAPSEPAAAPR